tara:strand:- start:77 stop:250 length:174 start_codon:yes stop_codon:yes gene_type:complete
MLTTRKLILNLQLHYKEINVRKNETFTFNDKRKAFVLLSDRIISYGERYYTQLLKKQ